MDVASQFVAFDGQSTLMPFEVIWIIPWQIATVGIGVSAAAPSRFVPWSSAEARGAASCEQALRWPAQMTARATLALFSCLALSLAGCSAEPTDTRPASRPAARATGKQLDAQQYELRGAGVQEGAAVPIEDVLAAPATFTGKDLRVTGSVVEVCKRKGCWMTLGDPERNVRITFKDYGFFVPLDCEGREVIAEGRLEERERSVDEIKHYLEDANRHEEAARVTEPRKTFSFVADGVALKKPAAK